ncbi:MAG: hypothetical protein HQK63_17550 [Desulfamplus sp.]|nr:hypothetical protein [Desulfamplus sp.]
MQTVTMLKINERLKTLSDEKLVVVFDFISYLADRELNKSLLDEATPDAIECMYASEQVLTRDWNLPEEDESWKNL